MKRIMVSLAVVAIPGALLIWMGRSQAPDRGVLPDGSVARLLAANYGTANPFTTKKPWHDVARTILPSPLERWIPQAHTMNCGDTNSLNLYFVRTDPQTEKALPAFWRRAEAVDQSGFVYRNHPGSCSFSGNEVIAFGLRNYPRRQRQFKLRIFDDKEQLATELQIRNPFTGPFPQWTPQALPMVQTNQGVVVTLKGLHQQTRGDRTYWRPEIEIQGADGRPTPFQLRQQWLEDATGNRGDALSPREPCWKLGIRLFRPKDYSFSADERWELQARSIPEPGTVEVINEKQIVAEIAITVQTLAGAGQLVITNQTSFFAQVVEDRPPKEWGQRHSSNSTGSWETFESDCPFFIIQTDAHTQKTEVLILFQDERGQLISPEDRPYGYSSGSNRTYHKRLKPAPDTKTIRPVFIVNHGLEFEFLVNPADVVAESAVP